MKQKITEGRAIVEVYSTGKISKKMPVFYNPSMKNNRDISILLLNNLGRTKMRIADPLAGSGIRAVRFAKELRKSVWEEIMVNDQSPEAVKLIKKNLKNNGISNVRVTSKDANLFLLESEGFDYIDIDPFGSPNPFLDAAVKRIAREGILAITATDTAPLSGTYPEPCRRKYWAEPSRTAQMHELGLRILIRKIQLIGAQYEKALVPIYSYSQEHYMRCFLICHKGKVRVDEVLRKHLMREKAGPLWTGDLWETRLAHKMSEACKDNALRRFLTIISNESRIRMIGFVSLPDLAKRNRVGNLASREEIISRIRKKGYQIELTHFDPQGYRTNAPEKVILSSIHAVPSPQDQ